MCVCVCVCDCNGVCACVCVCVCAYECDRRAHNLSCNHDWVFAHLSLCVV